MAGDKTDGASHNLFQQAVGHFTHGRHVEAASILAQAAERGDAEAQNLLGVMYLNGLGVAQEPRRAAQLFSRAAEHGLKEGRYNLCNLLYNGLGVAQDDVRAQEQLLASARAGHRPALRALGFLYHLAGRESHWQELSTRCFRMAAEAGDVQAKYTLGMRLAQGHGAAVDEAAARQWFTAAAQDRVYLAGARLAELRGAGLSATPAGPPGQAMTLEPFSLHQAPAPQPSRSVAFMSEYRGCARSVSLRPSDQHRRAPAHALQRGGPPTPVPPCVPNCAPVIPCISSPTCTTPRSPSGFAPDRAHRRGAGVTCRAPGRVALRPRPGIPAALRLLQRRPARGPADLHGVRLSQRRWPRAAAPTSRASG